MARSRYEGPRYVSHVSAGSRTWPSESTTGALGEVVIVFAPLPRPTPDGLFAGRRPLGGHSDLGATASGGSIHHSQEAGRPRRHGPASSSDGNVGGEGSGRCRRPSSSTRRPLHATSALRCL